VLFGVLWLLPAYVLFRYDWIVPVANVQMAIGVSYLAALGLRLSGEERSRAHLRQMFGQFVSEDVVEHLVATGIAPHLGGQACEVTVLFADIRNFTAISEILPPPDVVEMLNTYFTRVCEPILAQGGMINKFIGDAVMAVFGAPAVFPDHAERAIRAALTMKATAQEFRVWMQERFPATDLPEFRIGIGVHSGEAVVGNIGSTQRMEYTVIGDMVNIASRLESASKDLRWTIVGSAAAINAAKDIALTGERREIQVKGSEQAVEVFEVVGVKA
jgi:adenylate cyclase